MMCALRVDALSPGQGWAASRTQVILEAGMMQRVLMRYRASQHFHGSIACITDNAAGSVQSLVKILGFQVQDHSITR